MACRKYILTGGHGVGKSSLIHALEQRGETVIHEAASDHKKYMRALGIPFPLDVDSFEEGALCLHMARESKISRTVRRVFMDRGAIDHVVYSHYRGYPLPEVLGEAAQQVRYDCVFIIQASSNYGVGMLPEADQKESAFLERALIDMYRTAGHAIIMIPPASLMDRLSLILRACGNIERGEGDRLVRGADHPVLLPGRRAESDAATNPVNPE